MSVITNCASRFGLPGFALGALTLLAPSQASAVPIVNFDISVFGGTAGPFNTTFSQAGTATVNPGVYSFKNANSIHPAGLIDPVFNEWSISTWDFNADDDPSGTGMATGARLGAVFTVTNNRPEGPNTSDNHLYFSIYISMAVMGSQNTSFFGNGGMTLTAPENSGSFNQVTAVGTPIWNYLINGANATSLFQPNFNFGLSGPGTNSTSANLVAGQTGPLAGISPTSIGIRLDFDLTPGETVTFNGAFAFVPAPGCLALLGLAGLTGSRRRRD